MLYSFEICYITSNRSSTSHRPVHSIVITTVPKAIYYNYGAKNLLKHFCFTVENGCWWLIKFFSCCFAPCFCNWCITTVKPDSYHIRATHSSSRALFVAVIIFPNLHTILLALHYTRKVFPHLFFNFYFLLQHFPIPSKHSARLKKRHKFSKYNITLTTVDTCFLRVL